MGTASIYGMDILEDMDNIRKVLGVCPQVYFLYPLFPSPSLPFALSSFHPSSGLRSSALKSLPLAFLEPSVFSVFWSATASYFHQHDILFEEMTPREHLHLFAKLKGKSKKIKIFGEILRTNNPLRLLFRVISDWSEQDFKRSCFEPSCGRSRLLIFRRNEASLKHWYFHYR